jgi:hypothetical protein
MCSWLLKTVIAPNITLLKSIIILLRSAIRRRHYYQAGLDEDVWACGTGRLIATSLLRPWMSKNTVCLYQNPDSSRLSLQFYAMISKCVAFFIRVFLTWGIVNLWIMQSEIIASKFKPQGRLFLKNIACHFLMVQDI